MESTQKPFFIPHPAPWAHGWLLAEQQRLALRAGEPLFFTIRLVYDGYLEVDVETFTGRHGAAAGLSLSEVMAAAVEMMIAL